MVQSEQLQVAGHCGPLHVMFGSQTGKAEAFAKTIARLARSHSMLCSCQGILRVCFGSLLYLYECAFVWACMCARSCCALVCVCMCVCVCVCVCMCVHTKHTQTDGEGTQQK